MNNKRLIYFNIVSLSLLLLYMGLHLFIMDRYMNLVQGSEGLVSANVDFFGYKILSGYGNLYKSVISPSITLTFILLINLVFLVRFWKDALVDKRIIFFNTALITLSLFLYHLFLGNLNHSLELAAINEDFYFRKMGLFGFEFINITARGEAGAAIEYSLKTGLNFSPIPLTFSLIANIVYLLRLKKGNLS